MIRNRRLRRSAVAALVVAGALLLWLSPSVPWGLLPFALGVLLELAGLALERRRPPG
jgi:hypothetical protein